MLNLGPKGLISMLSGFKPDSKYSLNMLSYGLMCSNFSILEIYFPGKKKCVPLIFLRGGETEGSSANLTIRIITLISIN